MIGTTIANYKILEKIGAGGQGTVYKALDTKLGRTVVVKILPEELTAREANVKRFRREAQLASALDHPNICTIFDLNEVDGTHFIAMQYVEGRNVRQLVDGKPLELKSALKIAIQVADALTAAHAREIIHRDIKAGNVIVTDGGQAKVLDFGLAKLVDESQVHGGIHHTDLTEIGVPYGTATYAAPEQARGDRVDHRADIFSTGVLLYEMLTGTWPFHGKTAIDVRHAVLHDQPLSVAERRGENVPFKLQQIIDRALAKEPGERYQRISEMRDALTAVLRDLSGATNMETGEFLAAIQPDAPRHLETKGVVSRAKRWFKTLTGTGELTPLSVVPQGGSTARSASATNANNESQTQELTTSTGAEKKSVAILPFKNLNANPATAFYEFSLADAVITELARVRSLVVRPSSAIVRYQGTEREPRDAGRELNVDVVLSAGYLSAGEKMRVNAQLLDVKTGAMIWSERIDAEAADLIAIQDSISQHIVDALRIELTKEEEDALGQGITASAQAYEEYLRGRDALGKFIYHTLANEDVETAIKHFQTAIELDPNFARAYCALGGCYANRVIKCVGDADDYVHAQMAFDRGLALDPKNIEARMHTVFLQLARGDKAKAREIVSRLRYEAPNDTGVHFVSSYLYRLDGQYDKSLRALDRMLRLNPSERVVVSYNRARIFMYQNRLDDALAELAIGAEMEPEHPLVQTFIAVAYFRQQRLDEAEKILRGVFKRNPELDGLRSHLSMIYSAQGKFEEARKQLTERVKEVAAADHDAPYWLASAYVMLNETDDAFFWLEKAVNLGNENLPWFLANPIWQPLHEDERFTTLMNAIGGRHAERLAQRGKGD